MSFTYGTQAQITLPNDATDTVDAVDLNGVAQPLWDQHDFLDTLVALQAILVPTHGLVRYVRGYGHYTFVTSGTYSASTLSSPYILTATDGTAGRWVNELAGLGLATLSGRGLSGRMLAGCSVDAGYQTRAVLTPPDDTNVRMNADHYIDLRTVANLTGHILAYDLGPLLYQGATIASVTFYLDAAGGHGALPTMPSVAVYRSNLASAPASAHLLAAGWLSDSSANVAAYEVFHSIVYTPNQNNVVDKSQYSYFAYFQNEMGANRVAGLEFHSIVVVQTLNGILP